MNMDTCEQIFTQIEQCNNVEEFNELISSLLDVYDESIFNIATKAVWRARKIYESPFTHISEMSHPPKHLTPTGRLNDQEDPMFYAAFDKETAISEINPKDGDLIQLARFELPSDNELKLAIIGEHYHIKRNDHHFISDSETKRQIKDELNSFSMEDRKIITYIDKFFLDLITDQNAKSKNYILSRGLKKLICKKLSNNIDGFIYRSSKPHAGFNIALNPIHVNSSVPQMGCWILEIIKQRRYGVLDYKEINSAKGLNSDNEFIWKN